MFINDFEIKEIISVFPGDIQYKLLHSGKTFHCEKEIMECAEILMNNKY